LNIKWHLVVRRGVIVVEHVSLLLLMSFILSEQVSHVD